MIKWEEFEDTIQMKEESAREIIGHQVKRAFIESLESSTQSPFNELIVSSGSEAARDSALDLERFYKAGTPPLKTDYDRYSDAFIRNALQRLRKALCAEFTERTDVSMNARGLIIALVPTTVSVLGLPVAYAALSLPIAVVVSRIGLRTLCEGYEDEREDKEFIRKRIEIHRKNLLFLEEERSRYSREAIPQALAEAISREEEMISALERDRDTALAVAKSKEHK